jgi:hypothetical protein
MSVSRQQLLTDLKKLSDKGELLNCAITKAIDENPCDYQEVFRILREQLKFMRRAERTEFGSPKRRKSRAAEEHKR